MPFGTATNSIVCLFSILFVADLNLPLTIDPAFTTTPPRTMTGAGPHENSARNSEVWPLRSAPSMLFSSLVLGVTVPASPCSFSVLMFPALWPVLVHSAPSASQPLNSPTTFLSSYWPGPYSPTVCFWALHEIWFPFAASSTALPVSAFLALVNLTVLPDRDSHSNFFVSVVLATL